MKKMTILATSIALALTGCGSDSGSNNGEVAAGGIIVTGMDGYYQNAVVFDDINNNGVLDTASDLIYGITDSNGQLTLDADTALTGALALQVIAPGGDAQSKLIAYDSTTYAGIYTIDTDYPSTSLKELVLRTPATLVSSVAAVISPITDLVAISLEGNDNPTNEEISSAESDVATSLGIDVADIYSDYIVDDNSSNHKKAQILAASKANASEDDYEAAAELVAAEAERAVSEMSADNLNDINDVPVVVITGDATTSYSAVSVSNSTANVTTTTRNTIQTGLNGLNAQQGIAISAQTFDVSDLFNDTDLGDSTPTITLNYSSATTTGITITLDDTTLTVSASEVLANEDISFTLSINDIASDSSIVGDAVASFTLPVEAQNNVPTVNADAFSSIQAEITGWTLIEGDLFENSFTIESLFEDADGDTLLYFGSTDSGLDVEITDVTVVVSGTPSTSGSGFRLSIMAADDESEEFVNFDLPEIEEGFSPTPSNTHALEGNTWYYLEHGYSDGDDTIEDYTRVWCDSILFEDGIVYTNQRSIANKTTCDATATSATGTYEVVDGVLSATLTMYGESDTSVMSIASDADDISTGAKVVSAFGERYTYFNSQEDVQQRISINSDDGPSARSFAMYLPDDTDADWNLGALSVSLSDNVSSGDTGNMDANIFFDVPNESFDCSMVDEFYDDFIFTGDDIFDNYSNECYTNEENGVSYAAIDFDLPTLTVGNVYSIIGRVLDSKGQYIEAVKYNITWTGTGNNE